jgi:hypothetical protein
MDAMSTSARVSSKGCKAAQHFWMESEERKNREEKFGLLPLNSASSEDFSRSECEKNG